MKPYHFFLIAIFVISWILASINPATPENWMQENLIVFFFVPLIILLGRYIMLTKTSYALITIFIVLHLIGAHYNYGGVPIGDTIGELMGTDRNLYDRFMHFSFGLLMVYPIRELFLRVSNIKGFWGYFFPINIMLSFSALYEMFEWIGAINLPPEIAFLFVGGDDPWDPIKDMSLAGIGAVITILVIFTMNVLHDRDFWKKFRGSFKKNTSPNIS
jgi:putative membrane protein